MTRDEVLSIFRQSGAILNGHFVLTSGLHSPVFIQKARVFMHADKTEVLCKALANKISLEISDKIDYVIAPAIGGIIPAFETSRHLGVLNAWVERKNNKLALRRFDIAKGSKVIVIDDIITTGLSIRETIECLARFDVDVLAAACLIDRSAGKANTIVPMIALAEYYIPTYTLDKLPSELAKIDPIMPGSRHSGLVKTEIPNLTKNM